MENSQKHKENHQIPTDILDDLSSRFIINVPVEERSDFIRICFQIELAHWFYLDFYCSVEEDKLIPCGIKQFAYHLFHHIPFLKEHLQHLNVIMNEFKMYKMSVPTYGAILMTSDASNVLLVQSFWAKSSWGFPKGKVNEDEEPLHCAIREVYEETGYDISALIKPNAYIEGVLNYQYTRLYIVHNVPVETVFVPRTRKEIKSCEWFNLDYLPTHKMDTVCKSNLGINANSFFMIMPFVKRLKRWLHDNKAPSFLAAGIPASIMPQPYPQPQPKAKKPTVVPAPVGTTQKKRQRHKSMGDLDGIKPSPQPLKLPTTEIAAVATVKTVTVPNAVPPARPEPITAAPKRNKPKQSITKRQLFSTTTGDTISAAPVPIAKPAADVIATPLITAIQRRVQPNAQYSNENIDKKINAWQFKLNNDPAIAKWKNFRFNNKTRLCQCVF